MLDIPKSTPKITKEELLEKLSNIDLIKNKLVVVGIRGYYEDTIGVKGKNDRGLYDDAIIILSDNQYCTFNGNTDPSVFRKGIATLKKGIWFAHRIGLHKGKYLALIQRNGKVTITRDGSNKEESDFFGINIHKGGLNTTSSEGCQTIHPSQYDKFINLVISESKRINGLSWESSTIPYILL